MKKLTVTEEASRKLKDVQVFYVDIHLPDTILYDDSLIKKMWNELHDCWKGKEKQDITKDQSIMAYRDFFRKIGINPNNNPPSVENIVKRFLIKDKLTKLPKINAIVDLVNIVAVRWKVPLGVFDLKKVKGEIRLDFSKEGEPFLPLGFKKEIALGEQILVIRDDEKILSQFCYRDSEYQKVTDESKAIRILGCQVEGIDPLQVKQALSDAVKELNLFTQI